MSKEYNSLHKNLVNTIRNAGCSIDEKMLSNPSDTLVLSELFSNNIQQVLICRISDRYCSSCVNNAVELFKQCTKTFDRNKIVYFLDCKENRVFKQQLQSFSIKEDRVFNVPMFNIDAEYANFPYYMLVDSSCHVLTTYFPNKLTKELDSSFICTMYNRIDNDFQNSNQANNTIIIDLDNFKVGEKHSLTYDFFNDGKQIMVDKISTSCECVSANIDRNVIPIGESAMITINYKAEEPGSFFREVYIWEQDNDIPITITLRGNAL